MNTIIISKEENVLYNIVCVENRREYDIQRHHYLDTGCNCMACSRKREKLVEKLKRGCKLESVDKIIHEEATREFLSERSEEVSHLIERRLIYPKSKLKARHILRNTFGNNVKGTK